MSAGPTAERYRFRVQAVVSPILPPLSDSARDGPAHGRGRRCRSSSLAQVHHQPSIHEARRAAVVVAVGRREAMLWDLLVQQVRVVHRPPG